MTSPVERRRRRPAAMWRRACRGCGRDFETRIGNQRYCAESCRRAAYSPPSSGGGLKHCILCPEPFAEGSGLFCALHRAEERARTDYWVETGRYPTPNPWARPAEAQEPAEAVLAEAGQGGADAPHAAD